MPTVIYNGQTLPVVHDKFFFSITPAEARFSCTLLVNSDTESNFITACTGLEDKCREKYRDFTLKLGATDEYSFKHSDNTGFLVEPTLEKIPDQVSTLLARKYRFHAAWQLPVKNAERFFRRDGRFSIAHSAGRERRVTFSGVYTAGGTNSALQNYNDANGAKTWAASVLLALDPSATFEKISETYDEEDAEKILNFNLQYRELRTKDTATNKNDLRIANSTVNYRVSYVQSVGVSKTGGYMQLPAVIVSISYATSVNFELLSEDKDLEEVYRTLVRPYLISNAYDVLGLKNRFQAGKNVYIVQSEAYNINLYDGIFNGSISFYAPRSNRQIIELSEMITRSRDRGIIHKKIWSGKKNNHAVWGLGETNFLNRVINVRQLGKYAVEPKAIQDEELILLTDDRRDFTELHGIGSSGVGNSTTSILVYNSTFSETYLRVTKESRSNFIQVGILS